MTYVKRYPGGFLDRPATTTPADSTFLNALETELIRLGGHITNADIDAAAAISASKLAPGANGQWIKTTGGAVVWSAIQPSDIGGYPADATKILRGDGTWVVVDPTMLALPRVKAQKSAVQSIPSAAWTVLTWDQEAYDTNNFHDNVTNNDRLTVPAGQGGVYLVSLYVTFPGAAATLQMQIEKNTIVANTNVVGAIGGTSTAGGVVQTFGGSFPVTLAAGDWISARIFQSNVAAQNVGVFTANAVDLKPDMFGMVRIA